VENKAKKAVAILVLCSFLFVACSGSNAEDEGSGENTFLDEYVYMPRQINFPNPEYPIQGATSFGERICYWYVNFAPEIVIVNMMADGSDKQETKIPLQGSAFIAGVQITDDGYYKVVRDEYHEDSNSVVIFGMYDRQGTEIFSRDLTNIVAPDMAYFNLEQAVFTNDGSLALTVMDDHGRNLYLFDKDGTLKGSLSISIGQINPIGLHNLVALRDGRVLALHRDGDSNYLQEVDFTTGDWGEVIPFPIKNASNLLPAMNNQPFDLLVGDGNYLYGYVFDTETITPLISWEQAGISTTSIYHIGQLADERIFIFSTVVRLSGDIFVHETKLFVLTRTDRANLMAERTVLTLGMLGSTLLHEELIQEVMEFNRTNPHYQIEIINYLDEADGDFEAAEMRHSLDMITGNAPDIIIYRPLREDISDFMVDLYTLIDSDPELDRTDFFPNILRVYESPAGTLPFIGNSFSISTMITMRDTADKILPLTFDSVIRQVEETSAQHVFGERLSRESFFFDSLYYSGNYFIDWDNNRAYLDSEDFITLLEIAAHLPGSWDVYEMFLESDGTWESSLAEYEQFRNGEQLLRSFHLGSLRLFRETWAFLGDIVAVGMPTGTGGQHAIYKALSSVGIYAGSQNHDAAWSFVRSFLTFDSAIHPELPLRIDKFDAHITAMMTPRIAGGEEQPIQAWHYPNLNLYAMTEEEAAILREIIDTADLRLQYDHTIGAIIQEVLDDFFNGLRTAEDTARIIQNRVQTVLNERR